MKKIIILPALLILLTSNLRSQDTLVYSPKEKDEIQTLFGDHKSGGFYGSFTIGYSSIDNRDAVVLGGRFSWVANHSLAIGLGGTGFVNEFQYGSLTNNQVFLTGGYGGFYVEPIIMPKFPVHISFPVLLGAGGISYVSTDNNYHNFIEDAAAFLIVEPSAELEFNVTRFFRLALGASYRFPSQFNVGVAGTNTTANADALRGWSYNMTFKFGKF